MISLCMIVKDEEQLLGKCLESVRDCVDEIIIVDTGSKDNTVNIAKEFGAKVFNYPWSDDFAAARNFSLSKATGQWILYLDADEELEPNSSGHLNELTENTRVDSYYFQINNLTDSGETIRHINIRMFRNNPQYRFTGALHEQILDSIIEHSKNVHPVAKSGLNIFHYGYLQSVFKDKDKARRNYRINKKMVAQHPNDPFYLYTLGNSSVSLNNFAEAATHYGKAINNLSFKANYAPSVFNAYASCLIKLGMFDSALKITTYCQTIYPDYTDIHFLEGELYIQMGKIEKARQRFEQCLVLGEQYHGKYTTRTGVGSYLSLLKLAEIYLTSGEIEKYIIYHLLGDQLQSGQQPTYPISKINQLSAEKLQQMAVEVSVREMKKGNIKPEYYLVLGKYFYQHQDLDYAQQMINKALKISPNIPLGKQLLQDIYRRQMLSIISESTNTYPHSYTISKYKDLVTKGGKAND